MRSEFFLISCSTKRRPGLTSRKATYQACPKRFQPIIMSTVAAMFGAVPRHAGAFVDRIFCGGTMAVSFSDLQLAFEFASSGGMGENEAYLDRQSGKIYWHSEFGDNESVQQKRDGVVARHSAVVTAEGLLRIERLWVPWVRPPPTTSSP